MEKPASNSKLDEEFNNFMYKVDEVKSIVSKLASNDKNLQEIGDLEAQKYLGENSVLEYIREDELVLKIKNNRTIINKKAVENSGVNNGQKSQEAFMEEVSRDADRRYKDKLVRKEKMETFKKQGNLAFKRGEYAKALTLFNKAIEQIKDNCLLYNNRALTCIHLKLYDKAKEDLEWALRLNEDCLKSWLLFAKVHALENNTAELDKSEAEALKRNPEKHHFIQEYIQNLKRETFKMS